MIKRKNIIPLFIAFVVFFSGPIDMTLAQEFSFDGAPPICPRWAFEPWVWEDYGNAKNSIWELVNKYEEHNIPVGAVIIDSPWEEGRGAIRDLEIYDSNNENYWSSQYNLKENDTQYADREYTFRSVPQSVAGSLWLQTANNSKTFTDEIAEFRLGLDATVYIAHDERIQPKPSWLSNWEPTNEILQNDEPNPVNFRLFKKNLVKDEMIVLGPNSVDGSMQCGMYTIIVKPEHEDYTQYNTFRWDRDRYPEPEDMIMALHDKGIRVLLWATGIVNEGSDFYWIVNDKYCYPEKEKCATTNWWKSGGNNRAIHIDFRKADARNWFKHIVRPLIVDMVDENLRYIDGWKCDKGADKFFDPNDEQSVDLRNYYYATFYRALKELNPEGIIVSRAVSYQQQGEFGAPISDSPINWQGDFCGDFDGLKKQMEDVYRSAENGYSAPGVEIGGYLECSEGISRESLIRYTQFGAMTPLMENGGLDINHEPWRHGETAVSIYRYYATLHSELVPYFFSYGVDAHQTGTSILRATDPVRAHHRLGEELFVSIVTSGNNLEKEIELPQNGSWIDYWSEADVYPGGTKKTVQLPEDDLQKFPIFIRVGAIIPMNVRNNETNHGIREGEQIEIFNPQEKITLNIYPGGKSEFLYHHPIGDGTFYDNIKIEVDETESTIAVHPIVQVLEAEDGDIAGDARIITKNCMSGGAGVGYLGRQPEETNHLEFYLSVGYSGDYRLLVDYISGEHRQMDMRVNGGSHRTIPFVSTGSWQSCSSLDAQSIELEAGENTIRFFNESTRGPDIDKITVIPVEQDAYEYILRVKSFSEPANVTAINADALDWFYRDADDMIIIYVNGNDFEININGLNGYGNLAATP